MDDDVEKLELIKKHIETFPGFPKPGVSFKDIFSVLRNPKAFSALRDVLFNYVKSLSSQIDCIVALDSRGFLFGPILALELQVPFVPIRKKGKLPGNTYSVSYKLEYGEDTLQIQVNSISKGTKVLIVDDLLATGGSLAAACNLVESTGAEVVACLVIMEINELKGREKIKVPIHSFVQY